MHGKLPVEQGRGLASLPLPAPVRALLRDGGARQLVRFVFGGLAVTLFAASIYTIVVLFGIEPLAANVVSHGCGMSAGYLVHSRWSFGAETGGGEGGMISRFLLASGCAFLLNSFWVWLAVDLLGLHPLAPLPGMIFVTPLFSFVVNRYWVFRVG